MKTKQSKAALIRLAESGISEIGNVPSNKLHVLVRDIEATGSPPSRLLVHLVIRFLPTGAPFCCGEPSCHSVIFRDTGREELGDYLRRKMNLRQTVAVDFKIDVRYYDGIEFSYENRNCMCRA